MYLVLPSFCLFLLFSTSLFLLIFSFSVFSICIFSSFSLFSSSLARFNSFSFNSSSSSLRLFRSWKFQELIWTNKQTFCSLSFIMYVNNMIEWITSFSFLLCFRVAPRSVKDVLFCFFKILCAFNICKCVATCIYANLSKYLKKI